MSSSKIIMNRTTRLITSDWDAKAREDISSGKGFRITEDGKSDMNTEPGMYSIHSPLYGTDFHDEHAFEDRYSCKCGTYTGKNFNGMVCPKCKSKVQFIDVDITTTGWIILDKDQIINPIYYKKIRTFIGTKIFPEIIKFKDEHEKGSSSPFDGIGCLEFRERFDEIMDYFMSKNKSNQKKRDLYFFIMNRRDLVFTHSIPVYSTHLRPFVIRGTEIKYSDDDKLFKHIFTNSKMLNDRYELERRIEIAKKRKNPKRNSVQYLRREHILYSIQMDLDKLWESSFDTIKKKTGKQDAGQYIAKYIVQNSINCGEGMTYVIQLMKINCSLRSQLLNYYGDILVAKGNSGGIVIKVENRGNRRSEVSYKDKI